MAGGKKNFKCGICGLILKSQRGLTQHVNQKHADNNNNNNNINNNLAHCRTCLKKIKYNHMARHAKVCKEKTALAIVKFINKIITNYNNNNLIESVVGDEQMKKKIIYDLNNNNINNYEYIEKFIYTEVINNNSIREVELIPKMDNSSNNDKGAIEINNDKDNNDKNNDNNMELSRNTLIKLNYMLLENHLSGKEINKIKINQKFIDYALKELEIIKKEEKVAIKKTNLKENQKKIREIAKATLNKKIEETNREATLFKVNNEKDKTLVASILGAFRPGISSRKILTTFINKYQELKENEKIKNAIEELAEDDYQTDEEIENISPQLLRELNTIRGNYNHLEFEENFLFLCIELYEDPKDYKCPLCGKLFKDLKNHYLNCKVFEEEFKKNKINSIKKFFIKFYPLEFRDDYIELYEQNNLEYFKKNILTHIKSKNQSQKAEEAKGEVVINQSKKSLIKNLIKEVGDWVDQENKEEEEEVLIEKSEEEEEEEENSIVKRLNEINKEKSISLDEKLDEDIKIKEKHNKILTKFKIKEEEENKKEENDQVKNQKKMKSLLGQKTNL